MFPRLGAHHRLHLGKEQSAASDQSLLQSVRHYLDLWWPPSVNPESSVSPSFPAIANWVAAPAYPELPVLTQAWAYRSSVPAQSFAALAAPHFSVVSAHLAILLEA